MSKQFRTWDSVALADAAGLGLQIKEKIETICVTNETIPENLPDSLIPTDKLYILAVAYLAAYDKLIEYELVKTGNIKSTKSTH